MNHRPEIVRNMLVVGAAAAVGAYGIGFSPVFALIAGVLLGVGVFAVGRARRLDSRRGVEATEVAYH